MRGILRLTTGPNIGGLFLQCVSDSVLETADVILNLTFNLIDLAFGLQLGITDCFADPFFDRALDLFRRPGDPILIDGVLGESWHGEGDC